MLVSVEEMSPHFLSAEKNVREKLKKINQVIDRADGLYHQKAASGRDVSIHDDDDEDNNNNFNKRGLLARAICKATHQTPFSADKNERRDDRHTRFRLSHVCRGRIGQLYGERCI